MDWPADNAGIILMLLSHEGGFVNNPNDKGGPTNMGITLDQLASFRKAPVTPADVKALTVQEASALYLQKFIVGPSFDQITDVRLRAAMVDFGVLFGPIRAIQALHSLLISMGTYAVVDGVLGPNTLSAVNAITDSRQIINQLSSTRISLHAARVTKDPTQLVFLSGWLSRALIFID